MPSKHSFFVAAACALPLSFAACGSSGGGGPPVPEGPHYGYVVSSASVPKTDQEATSFGLDLGSSTSSQLDHVVDNKLGKVLAFLAGPPVNINIQSTVTTAIDRGNIILLIDVQTKDLMNSSAAGFGVKIGTMPVPPACTDATDMVCRHHLDGHGSFTVAADSPADAVGGTIASGAFTGGPGEVALQIAIGTTTPINLDLIHARVQATIKPDNTLTATIGGLVTQDELKTQIGPVLQSQVMSLITTQCTPGGAGTCGCPASSTAATLLGLGIDANGDCMISVDEILNFTIVKSLLLPDSCSKDSCTTADSLSIGVQVQAVKATFPGVM